MASPRRVRFALSSTSDNDQTPQPPRLPRSPVLPSERKTGRYGSHVAHIAALVASAVEGCAPTGDSQAVVDMAYSSIPRLIEAGKIRPAAEAHSMQVGTLAADGSRALAWTGKEWIGLSDFVVAAGLAAQRICGKRASVRHKAVVRRSGHNQYLLRLIEFPHGEQRGRFFVMNKSNSQ